MTSRLDRLFLLLESGSSAVTRKAAAQQLGQVQRLHPHDLHHLLARISVLLKSQSWETRIAAGHAVEAVVRNVPPWDPPPVATMEVKKEEPENPGANVGRMTFDTFDLEKVLLEGNRLVGSEGNEFELDVKEEGTVERLASQKAALNATLGFTGVPECAEGLINDEDLILAPTQEKNNQQGIANMVQSMTGGGDGMSSREMNRAKRVARLVAKQRSKETTDDDSAPESKKSRLEVKQEEEKDLKIECSTEGTTLWEEQATSWPFEEFCEQLCLDLFSSIWEVRHGAATALREVIKTHGGGAGRSTDMTAAEMSAARAAWLEDVALRIVCILALDRFGDFVSDQVVAPVRETCAQTLGVTVCLMTSEAVQKLVRTLVTLLTRQEWEARHGSLLGLKYIVAVKGGEDPSLLPLSLPYMLKGLDDPVEDVGAVAAASLIPAARELADRFPDQLGATVERLWNLLSEQDELAAASNSYMGLLAALINQKAASNLHSTEVLAHRLPQLWPFLSHSSSAVRKSTLQTLSTLAETIVSLGVPPEPGAPSLLQNALRHIFQRVLLETNPDIQALSEVVWGKLLRNCPLDEVLIAACPVASSWMCLAMQSYKIPFDSSILIKATLSKSHKKTSNHTSGEVEENNVIVPAEHKSYIGGGDVPGADAAVVRARCMACRMLGTLSYYLVKPFPGLEEIPGSSPVECYVKVLMVHLHSKSALQRLIVGLVVSEWAQKDTANSNHPDLVSRLHLCLNENVYFDEIAHSFTKLMQETKDFVAMLRHYQVPVPQTSMLTLEQISQLSNSSIQQTIVQSKLKPKTAETLEERRKAIQNSVSQTSLHQCSLAITTHAALAGAIVSIGSLPEKLHPVVKPLMEAIKKEQNEMFQALAAKHLTHLVEMCVNRSPSPNAKIVTNLCAFLRSDPEFTPVIMDESKEVPGAQASINIPSNKLGILSLINQQKNAERAVLRRATSVTGRGPGRPAAIVASPEFAIEELLTIEDETQRSRELMRQGATLALTAIAAHFGSDLPTKLPGFWETLTLPTQLMENSDADSAQPVSEKEKADRLIASLQVLEVVLPHLHPVLRPKIEQGLPQFCNMLSHKYRAVRHMSSRVLAVMGKLNSVVVMKNIVERVLPLLESIEEIRRQGAIESIACLVDSLGTMIIPFAVLLAVPVLGRMSDQNPSVRMMATHSFATLIQLIPLDGAVAEPPEFKASLGQLRDEQRRFLEQLFNTSSIENYKVPVPLKAELRSYQQAGVNWLAFLNRYNLHGILCDDMGLGKTLQSICILAGDHFTRAEKYKNTKLPEYSPRPSIVICPPTLTGHWVDEVAKFLSKKYLNPLQYVGPPNEREKLRSRVKTHNLIVASYDIVRKDINFFRTINWNYCILDEGHVIKNGKTKSSKAIKQLTANHRLILSGTPIQNNVLELWSLFDFLMPSFLGTERQFTARYSRPILASRDPKSSPKEQEAGVLAMESLHRQVLPFLLRRIKSDVLQDLPPKITQDYVCELSPLQQQLYEDFQRTRAHQTLNESISRPGSEGSGSSSGSNRYHIFQALHYLQNVCNHPKLVLTQQHPQFDKFQQQLKQQGSTLADIQHAAKLPALKQLLLDCGIGVEESDQTPELVVNQHRALIFCQLKTMLDIVEKDLLRKHMPSVTYLRLDGSIPPGQRHKIVSMFNSDPSIDVLLLTTQVGGLGLNLTGADTVIFVEHDWNPMKDLQAMDRAHRIGQKKVVNVYRLITRATLEEKIMGLQKFKLLTANTVINSENNSLESMGSVELMDLFTLNKNGEEGHSISSGSSITGKPANVNTVLAALPELWDVTQYEEEYDLSNFLQGLK
ncbi:Hypothetical predicted protein [Cloeon dipterum]|uniref:Helicase ATP-binding domain-containing protein n=1 Tax=Cloeon dipterum TaxID=197152 RepID=A0A8S1CFZ9_9INSE|nr:Hypothetical predicted protein [Cloeon dipterum]